MIFQKINMYVIPVAHFLVAAVTIREGLTVQR